MVNSTQSPSSFYTRHKWLCRLTISVASFIVACCLVLFYVIHFESGTALVWRIAKSAMGGSLSGDLVGGRLQDGIQIDHFQFKNDATDIQADRIRTQWGWQFTDRTLTINTIHLGNISVKTGPSKDDSSTTLSLPDHLALPINIDLQDISFDQLTIAQDKNPLVFQDLSVSAQLTQASHTVSLHQLITPWGQLAAQAQLGTSAPFALNGHVQMHGTVEQQHFQISSQISGTLKHIGINLTAEGDHAISGKVQLAVSPFDAMPLHQLKADILHFNPRLLSASAPEADFTTHIDLNSPDEAALQLQGLISITNNMPGAIQDERIPVKSLQVNVDLTEKQQTISDLLLQLADNGTLKGQGQFTKNDADKITGQFNLTADKINLHALHQMLHTTSLSGPLQLDIQPDRQHILVNLKDKIYGIYADAALQNDTVTLSSVKLAANRSVLSLDGQLATSGDQAYTLNGHLDRLNPGLWMSTKQPEASINGQIKAQGQLAQNNHLIQFTIAPHSIYGNIPVLGQGKIELANNHLKPSQANLTVANNRIALKGSLGETHDVLHVNIDAPNLAPLGYGLSGLVKFDGTFRGKYTSPQIDSTVEAFNVHVGDYAAEHIQGHAKLHIDLDHKLSSATNTIDTDLALNGLSTPFVHLSSATLKAQGTGAQHQLVLNAAGDMKQKKINISTRLSGKILYDARRDDYGWEGIIQQLDNQSNDPQGLPNIHLISPLSVHYLSDDIQLGKTALQLDTATLNMDQMTINSKEISSKGNIDNVEMRSVLRLAEIFSGSRLPIRSNMVLNGNWDFKLGQNATGFISLSRVKGDLLVNNGEAFIPMNLSDIHLRADLNGQLLRLASQINSAKLGKLSLDGTVSLRPDNGRVTINDESLLNLAVNLDQPSLAQIGNLYGPQLRLDGAAQAQFTIKGSVGNPEISGHFNANNMEVSLLDQGISLNSGTINLQLVNNVLELQQFEFHGGKGTLKIIGKLDLLNPQANLQAKATADHLEIFTSPTRQLALSGDAILSNINRKLELDGKIHVNNALFDIPKSSAPTLDDDVVIVDSSVDTSDADDPTPESAFIPRVKLDVDLGPSFYFRDAGADLQLTGILHILREENQGLIGQGTINAYGVYEAFGTKLNIEQGLINFQGSLSNPDLNIRAMTQNQEVEAGVEVTGNANHPRVKLVSEPNVADEEKLSWLMFGKGSSDSDITQTQATSQALAAIGTYGGSKIAQQIGLDQFSIGSSDSGLVDDQVVSVGKTITRKISIGIEKSLTGPDSVARFTWNFSRRWSLVLRGGTVNGVNLTHNRRFD